VGQLGFHDLDKRLEALGAKAIRWRRSTPTPFGIFRADVEATQMRKSKAGAEPFDGPCGRSLVLQML
jgi:hypothetical protein